MRRIARSPLFQWIVRSAVGRWISFVVTIALLGICTVLWVEDARGVSGEIALGGLVSSLYLIALLAIAAYALVVELAKEDVIDTAQWIAGEDRKYHERVLRELAETTSSCIARQDLKGFRKWDAAASGKFKTLRGEVD